jgi:adenosylmethionine-8-amino-7-oxononanoate aminotransferase
MPGTPQDRSDDPRPGADYAVWHPYTATHQRPWVVQSARGVRLHLDDGRELIDSVSSWWSCVHGYCHPELVKAVQEQVAILPHVMLGGLTHAPAEQLAAQLVEMAPLGLERVFFADSGSVGVEVALKMAAQYWQNMGRPHKRRFVSLRGAYHGDTAGAMSIGEPDDSMHLFTAATPSASFLEPPRGFDDRHSAGEALKRLEQLLRREASELAAFVVEPIQQSYGGFNMYHPWFLEEARWLCDQHEVLLIADEVATGFGRTGKWFACDWSGITPDIMVLSKALTGGMLGMSATMATRKLFDAFQGAPEKAFMHGPTFMGNPTAAAAALKSLEIMRRDGYLERVARIEQRLRADLLGLEHRSHKVLATRVLGATGVVEVRDRADYAGLADFAAERGVWLRPFERYVYTMPAYVISDSELAQVTSVIREWFLR